MSRPWTSAQLLDLKSGIGQRGESVQFDVLAPDRSFLWTLSHIETESTPEVTFDGTSSTQRTLRGLRIGPAESQLIDPLAHRLRVSWVLDDGSMWPLGLFLFSAASMHVDSWGSELDGQLYDQSVILNQPRGASFSIGASSLIRPAIQQLIDEVGLTAYASIDPINTVAAIPMAWPLTDSRGKILNDLCKALGFYPWYFDNNGVLRLRAVPNPIGSAPADLTFSGDDNSRIIAGTIVTTDNRPTAPNRYLARGNPSASSEIVGVYNVPASAPNSAAKRGFVILAPIVDNAAITDSAQAAIAAQAAYANDFSGYGMVTFQTAPDPRDDGYMVLSVLGTMYREQSWSLRLAPGGPHTHTARRVYA